MKYTYKKVFFEHRLSKDYSAIEIILIFSNRFRREIVIEYKYFNELLSLDFGVLYLLLCRIWLISNISIAGYRDILVHLADLDLHHPMPVVAVVSY